MSSCDNKAGNDIVYMAENNIIQLRLMNENDISDVVHHVQGGYRGEESTIGWTHESTLVDGQRVDESMLLDTLKSSASEIYLLLYQLSSSPTADENPILNIIDETCVLSGNNIIGCIQLDYCTDIVHFGLFAVNPKLQNLGFGRWLLQKAEEFTILRSIKRIGMSVISIRGELIAWYERRGFKKTGITTKFPSDQRFGIPKVENLTFIEMEKFLE